MKKCTTLFCLIAGLFLLAGLQKAQAQTQTLLGAHAGFNVDGENFYIGANGVITTPSLPVKIAPALDFYFIEYGTRITVDANALYPFEVENAAFTPYAGAGLAIMYYSYSFELGPYSSSISATDVGINLLGGASFGTGNIKPFAEARLTIGGGTMFTLGGGVRFGL